jgi:hypothetical protein
MFLRPYSCLQLSERNALGLIQTRLIRSVLRKTVSICIVWALPDFHVGRRLTRRIGWQSEDSMHRSRSHDAGNPRLRCGQQCDRGTPAQE